MSVVLKRRGRVERISIREAKRRRSEIEEVLKDEVALKESLIEFIRSMPWDKVITMAGEKTKDELIKEVELETEEGRRKLAAYRRMLEEMLR